ncbi:hypothetical protein F5888DRAFT_1091527 [Russula emetica]|nr:hypothetical protein F5888DRAFT_1091527 [Russula emetica]
MSFESDLIQYPSTESTDALRPGLFFAPPPQHTDAPSPELFDQEVAELDMNFPLAIQHFDEIFAFFRDSIPPSISTPLALTYSDGAVYDFSLNKGLHGTHDSIHSAIFSNGPPSIPPLHPAEAQFEFGTSDLGPNLVGISPEDLSTAMQSPPTSVVPTPLPVHVTPTSEAPAPSPHSSKRKHNLKTHFGIHDKSKPFKCDTCGCRFSRENDLHRHCRNPSIHQKQISEADDVSPPRSYQ